MWPRTPRPPTRFIIAVAEIMSCIHDKSYSDFVLEKALYKPAPLAEACSYWLKSTSLRLDEDFLHGRSWDAPSPIRQAQRPGKHPGLAPVLDRPLRRPRNQLRDLSGRIPLFVFCAHNAYNTSNVKYAASTYCAKRENIKLGRYFSSFIAVRFPERALLKVLANTPQSNHNGVT